MTEIALPLLLVLLTFSVTPDSTVLVPADAVCAVVLLVVRSKANAWPWLRMPSAVAAAKTRHFFMAVPCKMTAQYPHLMRTFYCSIVSMTLLPVAFQDRCTAVT